MTLLILGASGHLGGELCRQARAAGSTVVGTYLRAPGASDVDWWPLDLRDAGAVRAVVEKVRPSTVVNAAYSYHEWATTADGAGAVAVACAGLGVPLVHVSSDVVHGGRSQPYRDDEAPTPITPYGAAKAAAETAVRVAHPGAAIVRTSLILGDEHSPAIALCLDLLTGRRDGAFFTDELRCPIHVADLAAALLELATVGYAGRLNVAGPRAVSRAELGALVAARYGLDPATVRTATLAGSGLVRPGELRLDVSRAAARLRTRLRPVDEIV